MGLITAVPTVLSGDKKFSPVIFQDHSQLANWRSVDQRLTSLATFTLDKFTLDGLSNWKSNFGNTPNFGRRTFQSIQKLEYKDGNLELVFPNLPNEKRVLGKIEQNNSVLTLNKTRYFDFATISKITQLALDYGIEFEFELLNGHQSETALKFYCKGLPMDASITIPLMLSVKGNPTEVTR